MPSLTVNVILLSEGKVLLTKREDFEVWCLPGGHVEPGESVREAAVREAVEETGLPVRLATFVGVYSAIGDWPDMHACAFTAEVRGEASDPLTPDEVVDMRWFELGRLPHEIMWWHLQRIEDAAAGRSGVAATQRIVSSLGRLDRRELYAARDRSESGRSDFFLSTFPRP